MLKFFRRALFILLIFFVAAKIFFSVTIFWSSKINPNDDLPVSAKHLIEMTNDYRQSLNLGALQPNARLNQAAFNKAQDLLAGQYFSHGSPDGRRFSDWIKEVNYQYFYVGENLAIDFNQDEKIFQAWLDSPKHLENIIRPQYQEIGLAAVPGRFKSHDTIVVVQIFGTRILGADENDATSAPLTDLAGHYFSPQKFWQKIDWQTLDSLDKISGWLIIAVLGLYIILYRPKPANSAASNKPPKANR